MDETKAIEKAFKTQKHSTSMVSVIDPLDPFKPAYSGKILAVTVDIFGLPSNVIIEINEEYLLDDSDDGVRKVPFTDIYQAHYVSLN